MKEAIAALHTQLGTAGTQALVARQAYNVVAAQHRDTANALRDLQQVSSMLVEDMVVDSMMCDILFISYCFVHSSPFLLIST